LSLATAGVKALSWRGFDTYFWGAAGNFKRIACWKRVLKLPVEFAFDFTTLFSLSISEHAGILLYAVSLPDGGFGLKPPVNCTS
jgi:hypothetical protein